MHYMFGDGLYALVDLGHGRGRGAGCLILLRGGATGAGRGLSQIARGLLQRLAGADNALHGGVHLVDKAVDPARQHAGLIPDKQLRVKPLAQGGAAFGGGEEEVAQCLQASGSRSQA